MEQLRRDSPYSMAQRYVGLKEVPGIAANPTILKMLTLDQKWPKDDSVPWCSAFVNYICWILRLPRSKSLMARSWLTVGTPINIKDARPGFDIIILKRAGVNEPGPENLTAAGHVGFFGGVEGSRLYLLSGNQGDSVSVASFPLSRVIGVRRLG